MARFDSVRALATRLIQKNGRDVTLTTNTASAPADADKPWRAGEVSQATNTVRAVIIPFKQAYVDGNLIRFDDKQAYVSAEAIDGINIALKDTIVDGNNNYRVVEVEDISPGEQKILWVLQLRR